MYLLLSFLSVLAAADDAKADLEKMQGSYNVVDAARNGRKPPAELLKAMTVTIQGDKITISDGKRDESTTFKLDSSTTPKNIDFRRSPDAKPAMGIYEVAGDTIKLAWTKSGGNRPKTFDEAEVSMLVLKRKSKPK